MSDTQNSAGQVHPSVDSGGGRHTRNGNGPVAATVWFAAFGDECVEAIGRLGVVRKIAA